MERHPHKHNEPFVHGSRGYEVRRHRHHRHHLRRKLLRTLGWASLIIGGCVLMYYVIGWISDATYAVENLF